MCCAAPLARAEGDLSPHSDDEVRPPSEVEPTPVEVEPVDAGGGMYIGPHDPPEPALPPEIKPPAPDEPYRPTGRFMIGAGFSSIEGFIATASIAQDNLFRTGNHLSLSTRISAKRQLFLLRFADPDVFGSPLALTTDLYNDSNLLPAFRRNAAGGSLTLSHPIAGKLRAFAGYRLEQVETEPRTSEALRTIDPLPPLGGSGLLSALKAGVVYSSLDNPYAPLTGASFGLSMEVADRRLGSQLEFTKLQGWAQLHQPLGPFTLHLRGKATSIAGRNGLDVPGSERLFLDGASDIRGYRPETFSPIDGLGRPVGGDLALLGSAELEVPLSRRLGLSAVGFFDAGGLFARGGDRALGRSVGFGLLWRSPIGPLQLSWAFPLDGGPQPSFVFGMGSTY